MYVHPAHLIIKIQAERPTRVGVRYAYPFQAQASCQVLLRNYPGHRFSMRLEPKSNYIDLTLCSDECGELVRYQALHYKPDDLRGMIAAPKNLLPLEFVHAYTQANVTRIAGSTGQSGIFSISSWEILGIDAM